MANKKTSKTTGKAVKQEETKKWGLTAQQRKMVVVALIIVAVVCVSVVVDNSFRNPPIKDETDSMNAIFGQDVLVNNPEITYDTVVEIKTYPEEKIGGKDYWRVDVIAGEEPNTKLFGPYYVMSKNSKIYLKDAGGQMVPYGV